MKWFEEGFKYREKQATQKWSSILPEHNFKFPVQNSFLQIQNPEQLHWMINSINALFVMILKQNLTDGIVYGKCEVISEWICARLVPFLAIGWQSIMMLLRQSWCAQATVSDVIIDVAEITNTSCKIGDLLDFCATPLLCWQRQFGVDHGCVISATTPDFTLWVGGGHRSSHLSNVDDEVLKCGHSKQFWRRSGWQNVIWSDLQLLLMFLMYKTIHKGSYGQNLLTHMTLTALALILNI